MHGAGVLLIAAGVGYWVLTLAIRQKSKSKIQKLGEVLGYLIIILSILGAGCQMYFKWNRGSGYYGKKGGYFCSSGVSCPFAKKSLPSKSSK